MGLSYLPSTTFGSVGDANQVIDAPLSGDAWQIQFTQEPDALPRSMHEGNVIGR